MQPDPVKLGPLETLYAAIAILVGLVVLIALFGQLIMVKKTIPPDTIVYVDEKTGIYYAPPYILGNKYPPELDISNIKAMKVAEAEKNNFKPDETCVKMGYFKEENNLRDVLLIKLGIIEPAPSRWNPDGSWNW